MGYPLAQSTGTEPLLFLMVLSSDHITPATGKTPTVTISKNGGAFATPAGAVSEIGNGWYKVAGNTTDSNTLGPLILHATATGADPMDDEFTVVGYNPTLAAASSPPPSVIQTTGLKLITRALRILGSVASGEVPTADEAQDALDILNDLIDGFAAQPLLMSSLTRTVTTLTNAKATYTVGIGGDINIPRPSAIATAGLILDPSATYPVEIEIPVFTDDQWAAIPNKTLSGQATGVYYDFGTVGGLATLTPWMVPNTGTTQLVLYTQQQLAQMTLAGTYTFQAGFLRFLRLALARDLAPEFGGWDGAKEQLYLDARRIVESSNLRMSDLVLDPRLTGGGWYDIQSDTVR